MEVRDDTSWNCVTTTTTTMTQRPRIGNPQTGVIVRESIDLPDDEVD